MGAGCPVDGCGLQEEKGRRQGCERRCREKGRANERCARCPLFERRQHVVSPRGSSNNLAASGFQTPPRKLDLERVRGPLLFAHSCWASTICLCLLDALPLLLPQVSRLFGPPGPLQVRVLKLELGQGEGVSALLERSYTVGEGEQQGRTVYSMGTQSCPLAGPSNVLS